MLLIQLLLIGVVSAKYSVIFHSGSNCDMDEVVDNVSCDGMTSGKCKRTTIFARVRLSEDLTIYSRAKELYTEECASVVTDYFTHSDGTRTSYDMDVAQNGGRFGWWCDECIECDSLDACGTE
jgi:hypothetical protein